MAECADKYADSDHFHFADPDDGDYSPPSFRAEIAVERHVNGANYLFAEGHVERLGWRSLSPTLTKPGSRFVNPAGR
jgi:prepilin-type processing-associated H-X9-DG protein